MIDLEGIPEPDDAPEPGTCIRLERRPDEEGLVHLVLEPPHRPKIAVLDVPLLRDLDAAVTELERTEKLKALVITGRSPLSFAAGADVNTIARIQDPELAVKLTTEVQKLFQRIHKLGRRGGIGRVRVVAAVGGPVLGGACELSMACDRIVLADHEKTVIGLPEVRLGIIPGWGGTQRMPRRIGVPMALDSILSGKVHKPRKALQLGLVDRLAKPKDLLRIADDVAMCRLPCPWRGRRGAALWLVDKNPIVAALAAGKARKGVLEKTGGQYPAPLAAIPLIVKAPRTSLSRGLRDEAKAIRPLATGTTAKCLVGLFQLSEQAKKLAQLPGGGEAPSLGRCAVIGAGVMGGGIASLMADKGLSVRLRDLDEKQLEAAVLSHRAEVEKRLSRRRLLPHEANAAVDRLEYTTEAVGFARCELAVEAVAERLEVKQAVFRELAMLMGPDAILATNTSSLSVDAIAEDVPHPERVVGMHFFNPVKKMPLVEIVRGKRTADEVVARVARLALDLGKTPVVTADVAGFLVNRVLGPYLDEAIRLVEDGVDPGTIDRALRSFGMPMGPCELVDEVGLDIAAHAGSSLERAYGERMRASRFLEPLVEAGQLGKKTGAGIYLWEKKAGRLVKQGVNPKAVKNGGVAVPEDAIVDRCVLAMVNEAARSLQEGVVEGPDELDLATVFGTGFAPFRGGVLRYADARGLANVVDSLARLASDPAVTGSDKDRRSRFEPADVLVEHVKKGAPLRNAS